jgi:hypothetical protein
LLCARAATAVDEGGESIDFVFAQTESAQRLAGMFAQLACPRALDSMLLIGRPGARMVPMEGCDMETIIVLAETCGCRISSS